MIEEQNPSSSQDRRPGSQQDSSETDSPNTTNQAQRPENESTSNPQGNSNTDQKKYSPAEPEQTSSAAEQKKENSVSIFSPEGVMVLSFAFMLDISGLIFSIFGFGFIVGFVGFCTIGVWFWVRFGKINRKKRFLKKTGATTIVESIPFVGMLPMWTITVFLQLKK